MRHYKIIFAFLFCLVVLSGCKTFSPKNVFKKETAHEAYLRSLIDARLDKTVLGSTWIKSATETFRTTSKITVPFKETGYFPSDRISASSYQFSVKRGERIKITLEQKPREGFNIYMDLFQPNQNDVLNPTHISSKDTLTQSITVDADDNTDYILRLQPELLKSGEYILTIVNGPSLGFPVDKKSKSSVQSFWGNERDAGARKHEGIDIMAKRNTPVVAAANGVVTRVGINNLGGKVVFMRPEDKNYSLYYAHLDSQLVTNGQRVIEGDTLGLMGNTGNAKHTVPHLHFGIYTASGAVDPYPFVNQTVRNPQKITGNLSSLNSTLRVVGNASLYNATETLNSSSLKQINSGTPVKVIAATGQLYKIALPDQTQGYLKTDALKSANAPLKRIKLTDNTAIFDMPNVEAPKKLTITRGQELDILGSFQEFYYVKFRDLTGWILKLN